MIIFDRRDAVYKQITSNELNMLAPECYIEVQQGIFNYPCYKLKYTDNKGKYLDWTVAIESLEVSLIPFDKREQLFLTANDANHFERHSIILLVPEQEYKELLDMI